jgi:hypothetical protein
LPANTVSDNVGVAVLCDSPELRPHIGEGLVACMSLYEP